MSLFVELKRRNVFKVGAAYLIVAWVLAQVASVFVPATQNITHVTSQKLNFVIIGALVLALGSLGSSASGEEFSWQFSGGSELHEVGETFEADGESFDATYYFDAVDDSLGPYALAAFLNRSSRVTGAFHRDDQSETGLIFTGQVPVQVGTFVDVTRGFAAAGRYVWRDSGWYAGGSIERADTDVERRSPFLVNDREHERYGLFAGRYLARATALELAFVSSTSTDEVSVISCASLFCLVPFGTETEFSDVSVAVTHVGVVGRFQYSLSGSGLSRDAEISFTPAVGIVPFPPTSLPPFGIPGGVVATPPAGAVIGVSPFGPVSPDRIGAYSAEGELFPTQSLGLRLRYARWDGDPVRDADYELAATWFFKRNIAVQFVRGRIETRLPPPSVDADSAAVRLIGRF
jgi:hypothetical protein